MVLGGLWVNSGSASHWPHAQWGFLCTPCRGMLEPLGLSVQVPFQECSSKSTHTPQFPRVPSDCRHFKLKDPLAFQKLHQKNHPKKPNLVLFHFFPCIKCEIFSCLFLKSPGFHPSAAAVGCEKIFVPQQFGWEKGINQIKHRMHSSRQN